jgi:hypothetical protein
MDALRTPRAGQRQSFDDLVVLSVGSNSEPHEIAIHFHSERSVLQPDASRPETTNLLEA